MDILAAKRFLDPADARWVVAQATRAPSVHNSQPWRFRWNGSDFDVLADTRRGLWVSDPDGRELTISCGAAVVNLLLALRQLGHAGSLRSFPDRHSPDIVARITVSEGLPATAEERRVFAALTRRHTHRGQFADRVIAPDLAVRLQQAAASQGCQLHYVNDPGRRSRILHLARSAERLGAADDLAREETKEWTSDSETSGAIGVPAWAFGTGPPVAGPDDLPGRDFDVDRDFGTGEHSHQRPGAIAVLTTDNDRAYDWLQAGQALESALLTAAAEWAFAAIHSRVTEIPHLRTEVQRELGTAEHPQLLLRFGYADTARATPRQSVDAVLDSAG
jgi:hypothetical protein